MKPKVGSILTDNLKNLPEKILKQKLPSKGKRRTRGSDLLNRLFQSLLKVS